MIRIALQSLLHERGRLLAAVAGVAFAANLVLVQAGLFFGFRQGSAAVVTRVGGDLWVMPRGTELFDFAEPLAAGTADILRAQPCVARVRPAIVSWVVVRKSSGGVISAQLIAAEPRPGDTVPWRFRDGLPSDLHAPMRVAVDEKDLDTLGLPDNAVGMPLELQDRTVHIGVVTRGVRGFTVVPYMFAEPHEARRILDLTDGQATYWAVDLEHPECAASVVAQIERYPDLSIHSRTEFERMTSDYWVIGSGAGATLAFAAMLGYIVGLVVVGQTLYSLTESRSRELAALKAVGASGIELAAFVLWQAAFLAFIGGGVGLGSAFVMKAAVESLGLRVLLDAFVIGIGLGVIVFMCALASLASVRRVYKLEAATVFK